MANGLSKSGEEALEKRVLGMVPDGIGGSRKIGGMKLGKRAGKVVYEDRQSDLNFPRVKNSKVTFGFRSWVCNAGCVNGPPRGNLWCGKKGTRKLPFIWRERDT